MKILIVNTSDIQGGAARAAYRLHKALLSQNIDSQMLVQSKSSDDFTIETTSNTKVQKAINKLRPALDSFSVRFYKNRTKTLFSPSWFGFASIVDKINEINPDIVHLHWICGGMMTIEDIARIKAPIVWSLHDNWAFTGGCHIMWECEKYKDNCGDCPRLSSDKENDLSRKIFIRKQKTFSKCENMTIVGLSKWLNECSKNSTLLKDKKHVNLPNPIDTNIFKPFDKEKSRELWNLPKNKKLVLFGANSATSDINKGFKELSGAMNKLHDKNIEFVVFGSSEPKNSQNFGFKTHYLGHLHDDVSLVTLYNAVDIMIVPSIQEAFGQTASEAMACGTPVVAFGCTGLLDIIDHKKNGYLAKPFDTTDLKDGIEWILNNERSNELRQNAREKVVREFDSAVVAKKYIELYKELQ
jgi:glycosyltransferase involved in cell wall biosynthesis